MNAIRLAMLGIALIGGLAHFFVSVPIFETGSDALNQIVGAINISEGRGYTLENGESVRYWPPLYAIYASAFLFFNNSFASLAIANSLLIAATSLTWSIFIIGASDRLYDSLRSGAKNSKLINIFLISSATLVIVHVLRNPSSDATFSLIFPLYLLTVIKLSIEKWTKSNAAFYATASIALVNSHNMGAILFVAVSFTYFILFTFKKDPSKVFTLLFVGIFASSTWLAVRKLFDLGGSHEFEGLFGADRPIRSAAFDLIHGPSDLLFFFWPIGASIAFLVAISFAIYVRNLKIAQRDAILALLGAVIVFDTLLFLMFTSITIHSGIGGRFALVQTLLILMFAAIVARSLTPKFYVLAIVISALPLASSGARIGKWYKEYHVDQVYQWNRSISRSENKLDADTLEQLRDSKCPDSFCFVRDRI